MTSGLKYPYTKYDRLLGDQLDLDLEFNPSPTPPSGAAGGAGTFKYWVDTTDPFNAVLRQCIAVPRATAGSYVPAEWITLGTVDTLGAMFHFNSDAVDFTGGGLTVTNLITDDLTVTDTLTVTGPTNLGNTNVVGTLTTNGQIETQGPLAGFVFFDRTLTDHYWTWWADSDIAILTASIPGDTLQLTVNAATGILTYSGVIDAVGYHIGGVLFATHASNSHTLYDFDGEAAIVMFGAGGSNATYYANDTHIFQNNAGTLALSISSTGDVTLGGTGNVTVPGDVDIGGDLDVDGFIAATGALTGNSMAAVTTVFAGTTVNTVEYQLRGIPFALTDVGSNYVKIYDPSQVSNMTLYATGENYHDATDHYFRNHFGLTTYAVFNSSGTANATGSWLVISDDAVKENVHPYNAGLAEIRQLNPVSYNYITGNPADPSTMAIPNPFSDIHGTTRYGLMASNVLPVIPEMVFDNTFSGADFPDTALKTILPVHLTYVLINAVKEIDQQLIDLETSHAVFAPLASPAFTGTPTGPTASRNTATTQLATTAFARIGTDTNDSAPTGHVGEYLQAQTLSTASIPLTTNIDTGVATFSLSPGDWDVWASVGFTMGNPNNVTLKCWINAAGAIAPSIDQVGGNAIFPVANGTPQAIMPVTPMRVSITTTTTVRLGVTATIGGGTVAAWGKIMARRVR